MRILLGGVVLVSVAMVGVSKGEEPGPSLKSLVEAEQAFAKLSETSGMRDAFLANLAEGSVVFQPGPVDGRKAYEASPNVPAMLVWKPLYADVSRGGDLGYTTGPWTFTGPDSNKVHGHYVTVWKKGEKGWKVLIDGGVSHAKFPDSGQNWTFPEPSVSTGSPSGVDAKIPTGKMPVPQEDLMQADREFSKDAQDKGFLEALLLRADPSIRVYRPGGFPIVGPELVAEALTGEPDSWVWEPIGGTSASSGDLGYTYGLSHAREGSHNPAPGAANSYLRIWKKNPEGVWKIVLDLANPLPATQ